MAHSPEYLLNKVLCQTPPWRWAARHILGNHMIQTVRQAIRAAAPPLAYPPRRSRDTILMWRGFAKIKLWWRGPCNCVAITRQYPHALWCVAAKVHPVQPASTCGAMSAPSAKLKPHAFGSPNPQARLYQHNPPIPAPRQSRRSRASGGAGPRQPRQRRRKPTPHRAR